MPQLLIFPTAPADDEVVRHPGGDLLRLRALRGELFYELLHEPGLRARPVRRRQHRARPGATLHHRARHHAGAGHHRGQGRRATARRSSTSRATSAAASASRCSPPSSRAANNFTTSAWANGSTNFDPATHGPGELRDAGLHRQRFGTTWSRRPRRPYKTIKLSMTKNANVMAFSDAFYIVGWLPGRRGGSGVVLPETPARREGRSGLICCRTRRLAAPGRDEGPRHPLIGREMMGACGESGGRPARRMPRRGIPTLISAAILAVCAHRRIGWIIHDVRVSNRRLAACPRPSPHESVGDHDPVFCMANRGPCCSSKR